ncbi:hypothetical protein SDC9_50349 [bioreactor metagenome]|uniref:Uncharacterized protein n=1 Tax=bioreactor metagenome TaxID=1076179 RepID=A0A644WKD3_9ZZZZ
MLKGKKSLYILIPSVMAVWGLIIYRVVLYQKDSNDSNIAVYEPVLSARDSTKDTCKMIWTYRDPFLDRQADRLTEQEFDFSDGNNNFSSNIKIGTYKAPEPEKKVQWPAISYHGLIKNKSNGKMVAVFNINKRQYLLSENQSAAGILIESADNKRAVVQFDGETKTIEK